MPFKTVHEYAYNSFGRLEVVTRKAKVLGRKESEDRRWRLRKVEKHTGRLEYAENGLTIVSTNPKKGTATVLGHRDTLWITNPLDKSFLLKGDIALPKKKKPEELVLIVDEKASSPHQKFTLMTLEMLKPYFNGHDARLAHVAVPPLSALPRLKGGRL